MILWKLRDLNITLEYERHYPESAWVILRIQHDLAGTKLAQLD